jgi:hypothetical protein
MLLAAGGCAIRRPLLSARALHAEVNDPMGDARAVPGFSNPPDLVRGTVDVSGDAITFSIHFAPGTFDRQDAKVTIELDTDRNPKTVVPGDPGLGIDYVVHLWVRSGQTRIEKAVHASPCAATNPCYSAAGTTPLTILADGLQTTLPLSLIGSTDGRMNFRVFTYAPDRMQKGATVLSDVMPDRDRPAARVP